MKTLGGLLLSAMTYLLAGLLLVLIVHAALPDEVDPQGHVAGRAGLMLDLCANALACFLAGAIASARVPGGARWRRTAACGAILGIAAVSTFAFWDATPAWYNAAILGTTPLFVAIGASWRDAVHAARPRTAR
jgi:hypothetical protein